MARDACAVQALALRLSVTTPRTCPGPFDSRAPLGRSGRSHARTATNRRYMTWVGGARCPDGPGTKTYSCKSELESGPALGTRLVPISLIRSQMSSQQSAQKATTRRKKRYTPGYIPIQSMLYKKYCM